MFPIPEVSQGYLAGAVVCKKEKVKFNVGKKRWAVEVKNAGDRPIQVCNSFGIDEGQELMERLAHTTPSSRPTPP